MKKSLWPYVALAISVAIMILGIAIVCGLFYQGYWSVIGTLVFLGGFILSVGTVTYMIEE